MTEFEGICSAHREVRLSSDHLCCRSVVRGLPGVGASSFGLLPPCASRAVCLLALAVFAAGCTAPREAARVERNVVYGHAGRKSLVMDICFPATNSAPRPVVVNMHGGAWTAGIKSVGTSWLAAPELLRRGYVFASIYYRLAPHHKFPAPLEDAKCAVRFLRAHAAEYNLDPNRIVAMGSSAGGHLAALLGTTDASAGFDIGGGWTNESSRVQAVVDMFGHADLAYAVERKEGVRLLAKTVFGTRSDTNILRRFSPVTYVTPDDPPMLLIHGEHDILVPLKQSELMKAALEEKGVRNELIVVKHAGHCLFAAGGKPAPSGRELGKRIADFVDQAITQPPAAASAGNGK